MAILCNDGNPCTLDGCAKGGCEHPAREGGCNDSDACTGSDTCKAGKCAGEPLSCDDGNSCTADTCAAGSGCKHASKSGQGCDDSNACTGDDTCNGTTCAGLASAATSCDDNQPCTYDTCVPAAGCVHAAIPALPCDDGDKCTSDDACDGGKCAGKPLSKAACDDGNACTTDQCAPAAGCTHVPGSGPCSDGDPCTGGDNCKAGKCVPTEALPCACATDGDCAAKATNKCQGVTFCDLASVPRVCKLKAGTAIVCDTSGDTPCAKTSCVPATGQCVTKKDPDGGGCLIDGDHCQPGKCADGACKSTGPKSCDDGKVCTADACVPSTGCVHASAPIDGKGCDDGDKCTGAGTCAAGKCQAGAKLKCDDGNVCTVDVCTAGAGCQHKGGLLDGKACDDHNKCTAGDVCAAALCKPVTLTDCGDANPCTADTCDPATGCAHDPGPFQGAPCDDGDACTSSELCKDGKCLAKAADCDDGNPCTKHGCDPKTGCTTAPVADGAPCKHPHACITATTCKTGVCSGGDTSQCGDLGDCGVQPGSLGRWQTTPTGGPGFVFWPDGGGYVLVGQQAKVIGHRLDHPRQNPMKPAFSLPQPSSSEATWGLGARTDDGGLVIAGSVAKPAGAATTWTARIARLDSAHKLVWQDKPKLPTAPVRALERLADGTFALLASVTLDGRSTITRLTAAGGTVAARSDKGPSAGASVDRWRLTGLAALANGDVLAVGRNENPAGKSGVNTEGLMVRYTAAGWKIGSSTTSTSGWRVQLMDAVELPNKQLVAVGWRQDSGGAAQGWMVRTGATGQLLSHGKTASVGLEQRWRAVALAADGALVLGGGHRDKAGQGRWMASLLRLGAGGVTDWGRGFDGAGANLEICARCLALAAADGWRIGATRWADTELPSNSQGVFLRTDAWGREGCNAAGECGKESLASCNDKVSCTLDSCDPSKGCTHAIQHAECEDGSVCTKTACDPQKGCVAEPQTIGCKLLGSCEIAKCTAGKCNATGELIDCNDGNPCTVDTCSTVDGCQHSALLTGALCRNGDTCREGTCSSGKKCSDGKALDCYDGNPCTADACTKGKGCSHTAMSAGACNDGDVCTYNESCKAGACVPGSTKNCGAGKACTAGYCHSATCVNTGLTFVNISGAPKNGEPGLQRVIAYAKNSGFEPDGNPYTGDTDCRKKLPVLCFRKWNYNPPYGVTGWSKGELRATSPQMGCGITSLSVGAKLCTDAFGPGWTWAHWHIAGQALAGMGRIPYGTRLWTTIHDQPKGNCWK